MTRLTDEEIKKVISEDSIIEQILGRKNTPRKKYDALLSAQIAKLQQYYKDMTPEELRRELAKFLLQYEKNSEGDDVITYASASILLDQILTLTTAYYLEKVRNLGNKLVYDKVVEAIGGEE